MVLLQGPAQAQNLRDSLVEAKSDIVVKVSYPHVVVSSFRHGIEFSLFVK